MNNFIKVGLNMQLSPDQQIATDKFKEFLIHPTQKEMVISGSPGRGKSWLTRHLIQETEAIAALTKIIRPDSQGTVVKATATTGKAADVLSNFLTMPVATVHSELGIRPTWDWNKKCMKLVRARDKQLLQNNLLIVDESPMIDPTLLKMIRQSTQNCKTLFVGDKRQLAAVGETSCCVFDDPEVFVELSSSQRFGASGGIAALNAHLEHTIDTGEFSPLPVDGKEVEYINGDEFEKLVHHHFQASYRGKDHAKITCWTNGNVNAYNSYIREMYTQDPQYTAGEVVISNSPVIQGREILLRTEEAVTIESVDPYSEHKNVAGYWVTLTNKLRVFQCASTQALKNEYDRLRSKQMYYEANVLKEEIADLRPPHASTVHKSQGSTYDVVFVDLDDIGRCNCPQTVARMLNVAVTRARHKVYLYGQLPYKYR